MVKKCYRGRRRAFMTATFPCAKLAGLIDESVPGMNEDQLDRAARYLFEGWCADRHLERLPEDICPGCVKEGYDIQSRFGELRGAALVGWKIAATSEAGQRHIDVTHPLIGRLFSDSVYASPATLLMRRNKMQVAISKRARPG